MKHLLSMVVLAATQVVAASAYAQTPPTDKATARAERRAQGAEAARNFMPGEGDPRP
jgi:hypothetical protein